MKIFLVIVTVLVRVKQSSFGYSYTNNNAIAQMDKIVRAYCCSSYSRSPISTQHPRSEIKHYICTSKDVCSYN